MSKTTSRLDELSPEQRRLLAQRLRARKAEQAPPPPSDEGAGGEYPLSFSQQRLWMLERMLPGGTAYNMPAALRIRSPLDPAHVQRAIDTIARRHGALRTRFEQRGDDAVQVVEPHRPVSVPLDDLSALPEDAREARLAALADQAANAPFDLRTGPPFRARVVRMGAEDHAILVTIHHIVGDGWSVDVFWRELQACVAAYARGGEPELPPLPVSFGEHARRERERLAGAEMDALLAWWRDALQGAPHLLELPADRPRPPVPSGRGGSALLELDAVGAGVQALAMEERATPFMVLLAAYHLLLGRYAGVDDVLVGTAIAGRGTRDVEPLMGFFANTLVMRGDLSGAPSFREVVRRVRAHTLGAFAHQELPFERLVEELSPERSLAWSPVVQTVFLAGVAEEGAAGEGPWQGLEAVHQELAAAKFDLSFGVTLLGERVFAAAEFASDLWERESVERMMRHYGALLGAALASPDAPASTLPLMPPAERAETVRMGAASAPHPADTTLHAWFARQAAETPNAPAVTFDGHTLTYAELDAHAGRLAAVLRARGAGPDVLVGLCVERSLETVAGILGILKSGAAYLPLDPAYPDDRLAYMLEDSGARLVLTTADVADRLPPHVQQIRLDETESESGAAMPSAVLPFVPRSGGEGPGERGPSGDAMDSASDADPQSPSPAGSEGRGEPRRAEGAPHDCPPMEEEAGPGSLAYVIYTSGSTGRPKGVQVTHANVVRLFTATDAWFGFGPDDVWTLFHSYAFDFSVWELWGALLYGGRLVVVPFAVSRDPARFLALLAEERVTVLNQTPSAFRQLIRADEEAGGAADLALRCVVFGGEALDPASLRGWVARRGDQRPLLVNMYGITETTVHVTRRVIREADVHAGSASPIGIPIPDLSVHVLDPRGEPMPVGVVGEMYVGGAGVARGYLGRPDLTAQRFVPDPFSGDADARLYRSGDLARRRADGSLEFFGRADDQVKVRGFRIELGEIESVLLEHPAVREAVVMARGAADDRRLAAWVAAAEGVGAPELRAHLLAHLPEYMVPSAFVLMDRLPLTRNGKTDRRALPEPDAADLAGAGYVAPRTPAEEVLAAAWAELLGVERVGAADSFFLLGGHSLLATRVVSRVREDFGVEVPVRAVFEHPTLQAFADEIDRIRRAAAGTEAPPLRRVARGGDLPLSFAQERLWFVDRLERGSPVYHMPFRYVLRGALDVDALRRAFGEVARRHEALRTTLPLVDDHPVQRIHPPAPVDVPLHDLSALAGEDARWDEADRIAHGVATRAFDLEAGPLWRAGVVRTAEDEHLLLVNLHHVIADGWSLGVLWNELSAAYGAFARGEAPAPGELPVQYADFAAWQRDWLRGDVLETQLAYWRAKLAGAPPLLELPTDRPRPAVQRYAGAVEFAALEGAEADAVLALARREGSTLFMVLMAALDVVLARWSGQDDVVVGTPIAGRTRRETEGLIGLFLNSLALRTDLSGDPTFRELLRRVRETTLEAYAHQDLPFERILEDLHPERSLSHTPVFQVMLNLSNFAEGDVRLPGLQVQPVESGGEVASKFDLTLYAGEAPGGIALSLVYNTALFDAGRMRELLSQLAGVLRQASDDADRPVARLSLLTDAARAALPDPAAPLSDEWRGSVPAIFAAHAARTPGALAVEDPAERWTYAELDADSNRIARRLIADGVRPGDVVAIHGHRSAPIVRALLGTMKAGAAFLILDPAYPPARLAEYVRIARPTGFLPMEAAGDVAPELADALRQTVVSTIPLAPRASEIVVKVVNGGHADLVRAGGRRAVVAATSVAPAEAAGDAEAAPDIPITPDTLAYLSFTSGTTGKPKAVMGRHGSLTHFTPWLAERFGLGAGDRFSLLSGLAHDPLHRDVFTPLQLGAAVVAPDPDEVGTPGYLAQWMRDARITVAHLTPAMGQLLVDTGGEAVDAVDALRRAFFVGDVLTRTDVERMHGLAPNLQVVNYYGSTETQRAVAHFAVPRERAALAKDIIPVGVGIPDVQVLIRNGAGERAGVGEVGEIWMRSPHVALGYLGDPELTAARFVDGAYRTGDLGRYRPDGVAEIAGRADQQVKIRGFRIEPGEVEAVLRAHPAVRDTAVVARGEGDAKRLVAYVVAEGEAPSAEALRAYLRGGVPDYMVPSAWVFLPALPVTPNGKVDRRALPEPDADASLAAAHVAPRTPTEAALATVWAALLDAGAVGAHDDFFALGGHSLLATRLIGRVRDALGVELPLRTLFEAPTLAAMAAAIDALLRADESADAPPPIVRVSHGGEAPASFAQERMWFVDRMEGGGAVYHIPTAQHLAGPVDVEAMRRAVEEVARRHETLRTALPEVDGLPVPRIAPPGRVELPFTDLYKTSKNPAEAEAGLARLAQSNANEPFDLEAGPLWRVSLVRVDQDAHVLLANLHHAIGDGWSLRVLLAEIGALHDAYRRGEPSPLRALPVQYADYAAWQRAWLAGPVLERQLGYWRGKLAGAPPLLHLPTDRPRPAVQGHRGASQALLLPPDDAARVAALARREGATTFMVLLAAFGVVLSRWSGERDVVVGTPIAGRTRPELEGLIGLFLNSLALRTDLSGEPTFAEVLRRVRDTTLEAYAHQDLPFERILEDLQPERSLGHTPVFQVMLNLLNYGGGEGIDGGEAMTSLGAGAQLASKFDLTLYAAETPEGLGLHAVYDADLFDAPRMRALLAQLAGVLRQAADDADRPAAALSLVVDAEGLMPPADALPIVVLTPLGAPAGIGELGEVWMRAPDGTLRAMGGAGRYRPDGSVELAAFAPPAPAPLRAAAPASTGAAAPSAAAQPAAADPPGRAPRTESERMVAAVWVEVLGVAADGVAADADFFTLGGHSLRATQVLARIRARTGLRIPVKTFFAAPTVAALAAAVDAQAPSASTAAAVSTEAAASPASAPSASASPASPESAVPAKAGPDAEPLPHSRTGALTHSQHYPPGVYPLSFAQQRLWVLMQLGSTVAYNLASALRLTGALDDWALERALDEIVRRHEALRTRIELREGEPVQVVQPPRPLRLRAEDVRLADGESAEDALRRMAEDEAARPFAAEGPFLRARLLRAADDDHVLLWTTHHLVSDGWSIGVFQNELAALYRSFVRGEPSPLQPLPVQYGEHALAQRRELSGPALDALVGWWRERLAGAPALLELPADRPRPAEPTGEGASFWFGFPDGTAERVGAFARGRGATPFMVLMAAFQALLARWSGQDDVVVGTPIANRTRPELERLIGFFANTLAIRGDVSGDPTFAALLDRVRDATLGAYDHQDLPFERLVEELNPERSLSHAPVFQVMLALQNAPGGDSAEMEGVTLSGLPRAREAVKHDLSLSLYEHDGTFSARVEYATALFGEATVRRMTAALSRLLEGALADPDRAVSSIDLLEDADRAALAEWNRTARGFPARTALELFDGWVSRTPDAPALAYEGERLSFRELDERARRVARSLAARGIGAEARVGLCVERSAEMIVGLLGILRAGAAYVPLDPAAPPARMAEMLADSGASLVLAQPHLLAALDGIGADAVSLADAESAAPDDIDLPVIRPESLAYVIYTSGSTGTPKGVAVEHRQLAHYVQAATERLGIAEGASYATVSTAAADLGHTSVFGALCGGGCLHVIGADRIGDAQGFAAYLAAEPVDVLKITPSHLAALMSGRDPAAVLPRACLVLGGEASRREWVEGIRALAPGLRIANHYGPTETTVGALAYVIPRDLPDTWGGTVPVGAPLANARAYVLDAALRPVPPGVPGELCIGGLGVARGYLRRAAQTAERFVPDPFADAPGARLYRTGDRARHLADGAVEFLGRIDQQVKIRGFRVEPGEVESLLRAHPAVREAAVVARPDAGGSVALAAYVVPADGASVDADGLHRHCAAHLPAYMVPGAFVPLDALPLTPNGKLDRRALPAPAWSGAADAYDAPRTPAEEMLAEIWAGLLGVERAGAGAGFFALGGHSLLATRMVSRVREVFGVELPLRAVFEAPVLRDLAARIQHASRGADADAPPPLVRTAPEQDAPLSFAQERLWFIERLSPGAYTMSPSLRLRGALDADVLARALAEVVRRHEPLRTAFPEADGAPVQRILPADAFPLPVEDLTVLADGEREAAVVRRATEMARAPFDLPAGPPFRAALLRLADDDHALLMAMHHAVSDGWSLGILFRELFALYEAFRAGRPSPLPPLSIRYADYAAWQRAWLHGGALDRQLAYWRGRLAGAPAVIGLPLDHARPAVQSARGASHPFAVPAEVAEPLRALARREGATLYMALLAAWSVLLSRWSGEDDVVVGTPVAGRTQLQTEALVGLFVNTLALRTDLSGDPAFRALLARVRETTLGAFAHQELPFEKLVEELRPERSLSHAPVFQVMFILQNTPDGPAAAPAGLELAPVAKEGTQAKVDLTLTVAEGADGVLHAALGYAADLWDADTMQRMAAQLVALLRGIAADADAPVSALPLMDEAERARLLALADPGDVPPPATVHALFQAQAARTPHATALAWSGGTWTYARLDAQAERIATQLRAAGAGPERVVAVLAEYGPHAAAALLGVLKSGAAYLPLDPAHPAGRLRFVLEDSAAVAVLAAPHLRARLPELRIPVLDLACAADAEDARVSVPGADPTPALTHSRTHALASAAYVIYTSGSTGTPKAVVVPHQAAAAHLRLIARWWGLTAEDRVEAFAALTFDPSVEQILAPLLAGASVALRDPEVGGAAEYVRRIRETGVTVASPPTGYWAQLVADEDALAELRASVRMAVAGGEAMAPELAARWYAAPGDAVLVNAYGPTEAVVQAAAWRVPADVADAAPARIAIGASVGGRALRVLDAGLRPVPAGVPGELYVGGPVLARGYLGRPALTAEHFVPDPFAAEPGARMYRTGDRVRLRGDGALEFIARADQQVKVRGYRIEPGEVEAALRAHPAVRDAAVLARADGGGPARLVAYVTAREGAAPDAAELRAALADRLPAYMVPSALVSMDAIPLTASGKVDRRALPAPEWSAEADAYAAPRTPTEELAAAVWVELLGVERVGIHDGFFELGGHSLLGTRVVSRIRERLGVEVPLAALFEAPRLADFAARVDGAARAAAGVRTPPIRRMAGDAALSFAQERLWFIDRLAPGSALYNMSAPVRLRGPLDPRALADALAEVVRRHEPLRTALPEVDGAPVQRIAPAEPFALAVDDLSQVADGERADAVRRTAREWARAPFDLHAGPLFRARLLRLADDDHMLLLAMHHTAGDGWSIGILHRELLALYGAFAAGRPSPLPPLPVRYADYAAWQRAWLTGDALERQVAYWRGALAGAPALLELPADRPRPAVMSSRGGLHAFAVPAEVAEPLRALARREGATLFMALLAGWSALLSRWSGQDEVVVGTPVAGRTRRETEGLIGLFVNTLALRTDLGGYPPFAALLARVRAATLGAYAHQDLPFEKLVEELQPERSLAHTPVFQAMLNLQNTGGGPAAAPGALALEPVPGGGAADAKTDVALTVTEQPDGALRATLTYAADLFEPATVERMAAQLVLLLRGAVHQPDARVAALPLLADEERAAVEAWERGPGMALPAEPLHRAFERHAARTPDATALVWRDGALAYAGLDARASAVARRLLAAGVRPGQPVAVVAEHSPHAVAALLGVLKSGGAYLPLDPASPAERLAFTLDDARAAAVLVQPHLADRVPSTALRVLPLDDAGDADGSVPLPEVDARSVAYVLYTSGSTGTPKGVAVPHAAASAHMASCAARYGLTAADRVLAFAALTFDPSLEQILAPLGTGASVALRDPQVWSPAELADAVGRMGVTVLNPPTAYLHGLVEDQAAASAVRRSVRLAISGGEALRPGAAARWAALPGSAPLLNGYGPTEAVVTATAWTVDADTAATAARLPIGVPLPGRAVRVLDARGGRVPAGVPGELHVGGAALADGYLGRPALTAAAFVPDPFAETPGARMYRTGDRARWRADGTLEYLGRTDFQAKVRGFRIEPGEVQSALERHPAVREAAVLVRDDAGGSPSLVAYVVADGAADGALADADALHRHCAAHLPPYMVPAAFVVMEALPLSPNGKLDRRALPAPARAAGGGYVVPRDVTELEVARIWAQALGVPRVGAGDDFFRLGGHSLLALRMMPRIRERFGRDLPLAELFRAPTVAEFAAALRREGAAADDGGRVLTFNRGGARPPLFFFPPAGGTGTQYVELARLLGPDQPFHALQAPGLAGDEAPLDEMGPMVERYLDAIRREQPHGPYWLGGWSAGGVVAYEAARRLREAGEEVALLALVDARAPVARDEPAPDRIALFRRFAASNVTEDEALLDALEAELRALPEDGRLAGLSRWLTRHVGEVMDAEVQRVGRVLAVFAATGRALRAYAHPPPVDAPVALFVASEGKAENGGGPERLPAGWRPFVRGELAVRVVPGAHATLIADPAVQHLARALREVMDGAGEGAARAAATSS